jgi:hypothetical protein
MTGVPSAAALFADEFPLNSDWGALKAARSG